MTLKDELDLALTEVLRLKLENEALKEDVGYYSAACTRLKSALNNLQEELNQNLTYNLKDKGILTEKLN